MSAGPDGLFRLPDGMPGPPVGFFLSGAKL